MVSLVDDVGGNESVIDCSVDAEERAKDVVEADDNEDTEVVLAKEEDELILDTLT